MGYRKILLMLFVVATLIATLYSSGKAATSFEPDFSIFYHSTQDVFFHVSPYTDTKLFTDFNYPLATTLFFFPLLLFSYQCAQILFTALSLLAVVGAVYVSFRLNKKKITYAFLIIVSLVFLSFPTKFTIGMGQVNLIAYALLLWGFYYSQQKKNTASLVFLVVAVLLKPVVGLSLFVLLLEKEWKLLFLTFAGIISTIFVFPYFFHMPQSNYLFFNTLARQSLAGREVYYNQGISGFVARCVQNMRLRYVLTVLVTLALGLLGWVLLRKGNFVKKLSILLTLLVLVDPLSWQHHFVFLILPFCTVWFTIQKRKQNNLLYKVLFFASYFLVVWNFKNPNAYIAFPLSLLLSNQFYAALLLFGIEMKVL